MPLAEFNIARARWDQHDPRMSGFFDAVPRINAIAERTDGFIWRLKDDSQVMAEQFPDDPRITMTLSLWRDVDSLRHFTWHTLHKAFRLRALEWFEKMDEAYLVLWEVPEGHFPTGAEALENLLALRRDGPSKTRFGTEALISEAA